MGVHRLWIAAPESLPETPDVVLPSDHAHPPPLRSNIYRHLPGASDGLYQTIRDWLKHFGSPHGSRLSSIMKRSKSMNSDRRLAWVLLVLRASIFLVMLMWTLDKFIRPDHAAAVFEHFYALASLSWWASYVLGGGELLLLLGFILGIWQRFTYGAVLALHAVSTVSSYYQYFHPYQDTNLLFFAAWPMLAACVAVYLLRHADAFAFDHWRKATS